MQSKKEGKRPKVDNPTNLNILQTIPTPLTHAPMQHTHTSRQKKMSEKLSNGQSQISQLRHWEVGTMQMNARIEDQEDDLKAMDEILQKGGLEDQLLELLIKGFDFTREVFMDSNILRTDQNQGSFECDFEEDLTLKSQQEQLIFEIKKLEQELAEAEKLNQQVHEDRAKQELIEAEMNERVRLHFLELGQSDEQGQQQVKQLYMQQLSLKIVQEQYYSLKRVPRTCCLFKGKLQYDESYQKYIKQKTSKQLVFDYGEQFKLEEKENIQKSKSNKKYILFKPTSLIKFEFIYNCDEGSKCYEDYISSLDLFIKGSMYKHIDQFHKNLSGNSKEYYTLYHTGVVPKISYIQKYQPQENLPQYNHNTILILSDKDRGCTKQLIESIYKILDGFDNGMVQVNSITFRCNQLVGDKRIEICSEVVLSQFLDQISNIKLFDSEHYQIEIELLINKSYKKCINILLLGCNNIENHEIFARQFKQAYKREKAIKDQLGSCLELLLKQTEKLVINVEIPYLIKINGKHNDKLAKIQNIMEFYTILTTK